MQVTVEDLWSPAVVAKHCEKESAASAEWIYGYCVHGSLLPPGVRLVEDCSCSKSAAIGECSSSSSESSLGLCSQVVSTAWKRLGAAARLCECGISCVKSG